MLLAGNQPHPQTCCLHRPQHLHRSGERRRRQLRMQPLVHLHKMPDRQRRVIRLHPQQRTQHPPVTQTKMRNHLRRIRTPPGQPRHTLPVRLNAQRKRIPQGAIHVK